jgi:hypothetical protein
MEQNLRENQYSLLGQEKPVNRTLEFGGSQNEQQDLDFDDQPGKPAREKVLHDDMPIPTFQNRPIKNQFDEKPIDRNDLEIDDVPIKPKVSNFEELLANELKNNPDAALDEPLERKPKQKKFLKRKKPVTIPPNNTQAPKYKYYAENFSEDPFLEMDPPSKPHEKKSKDTPFGNVAERKAVYDAGDTRK